MRIAIAGSTGLIGAALVQALRWRGDEVVRLVRRSPRGADERSWDPVNRTIAGEGLGDVDAVVNLAGHPIAGGRWTDAVKREILESRLNSTATIVAWLSKGGRCQRFLSGSAIGFYGDTGQRAVTEADPRGQGFLADVVVAWEEAAASSPVPTVLVRTGHVMTPRGGYLGKQLLLFQLGLGGRMGNGEQQTSWISLDDQIRAMLALLDGTHQGPYNLTAPNPVSNREFTAALGAALGRPTILPVPLPALRAVLGSQLVDQAILSSARVLPQRLLADGFAFTDTEIGPALARMLAPKR